MELTNTESFCISCHEMENNVYQEYKQTIHYANRTGVRATCPDCHVPRDWVHKFIRKIQASNELFHKIKGSIDTKEKFEAKRHTLAKHVWESMKETDSRECRNCHEFNSMELDRQSIKARKFHELSLVWEKTCIDCHKGISHNLPGEVDPSQNIDALHVLLKRDDIKCYDCHEDMARPPEGDGW